MRRRKTEVKAVVSATQLAEMGYCEMRLLLAHRLGERTTPAQRRARARGDAAHARYFAEGIAAQDRRCFIASHVFGADSAEARTLRCYRDLVLLRHGWGRALTATYYTCAPCVCRALDRWPAGAALLRPLLRRLVRVCQASMPTGGPR